jgi:hypothetical protein
MDNGQQKLGSTLAYNDENDNFKPLPFNFTRSTGATRVNKDGLIEVVTNNKPRIDFLNDTNGALLLEPSRTNSITYSNDFSQSIYGKNDLTITANQGISPDGTQNANLLVPNAAVGVRYLSNNTGSNLKINTVFLKKKELRYVLFGNSQSNVLVDLENGTISADSVSTNNFTIENYGNGWYRVSCYNTLDVNLQIQIFSGIDGSGSNIATNGTDGVYIYGFEIQNGSYATSYIPTQGATATRVAEVCTGAGNEQVINSEEGVLYAEIAALANDLTRRIITITDGTLNNIVKLEYKNVSNQIEAVLYNGNTQCLILHNLSDETEFNKIAFKYKQDDFSLFVNGAKVGTDVSGSIFPSNTLSNLSFYQGNSNYFYGNTKQIQYFNTALTDQELINLTTI